MSGSTCSWCHHFCASTEASCPNCEHDAHVSRGECRCPRCEPHRNYWRNEVRQVNAEKDAGTPADDPRDAVCSRCRQPEDECYCHEGIFGSPAGCPVTDD